MEIYLDKVRGDWSVRPEDFYWNSKYICDESEATGAPAGESFFSRLCEKIVGAVPVKSEGAVMKITVLIQKGCSGFPLHPF